MHFMFVILSHCEKNSAPGYERKETSGKNSFGSIVIEGVEDSAEIK